MDASLVLAGWMLEDASRALPPSSTQQVGTLLVALGMAVVGWPAPGHFPFGLPVAVLGALGAVAVILLRPPRSAGEPMLLLGSLCAAVAVAYTWPLRWWWRDRRRGSVDWWTIRRTAIIFAVMLALLAAWAWWSVSGGS